MGSGPGLPHHNWNSVLTVYLNRKLGTPDTLVQDDQGRLFLTLAKKKTAE